MARHVGFRFPLKELRRETGKTGSSLGRLPWKLSPLRLCGLPAPYSPRQPRRLRSETSQASPPSSDYGVKGRD